LQIAIAAPASNAQKLATKGAISRNRTSPAQTEKAAAITAPARADKQSTNIIDLLFELARIICTDYPQ
jgi:hypothetical protein